MTTSVLTRHVLPGLRPEPLASYLAGLGLIRVVGEQADPLITARWTADGLEVALPERAPLLHVDVGDVAVHAGETLQRPVLATCVYAVIDPASPAPCRRRATLWRASHHARGSNGAPETTKY
jgi:hypothetical protein